MANRTKYLNDIWAMNAIDVIPNPIPEIAYAKSSMSSAEVEQGWRYKKVESCAIFNETMRRITGVLQLAEQYGILPWCASITYPANGLVIGSNGKVYYALQSTLNNDPISSSSYWRLYLTNAGLGMAGSVYRSYSTAQRLENTGYYNYSNGPMWVTMVISVNDGASGMWLMVDGTMIQAVGLSSTNVTGSTFFSPCVIVPPGSYWQYLFTFNRNVSVTAIYEFSI
jgi:hypothetical protein